MTGRKLVLIRHSVPEFVTGVPADRWHLSSVGRQRCGPLADSLAPYAPGVVVSSREQKAIETATILADRLQKPFEMAEGLHEHQRPNVSFIDPQRFEAAIAALFVQPQQLVMGIETADQAHRRFADAVADVLVRHPDHTVAIVAHGTVIALFVSHTAGLDPFPFWQRLGMPAVVVFALPSFRLLRVLEQVG